MTLLICRTCPRYDVPANGEFRRALDAQIVRNPAADPDLIRHVQCLTGCPDDGVAALDGPGKARVRFTRLSGEHAAALVKAANAHDASPTGAPEDWEVPAELVDHISNVTFKRAPVAAAPSARPQTPFVWRRGAACASGSAPTPRRARPNR